MYAVNKCSGKLEGKLFNRHYLDQESLDKSSILKRLDQVVLSDFLSFEFKNNHSINP